MTSLFATSATGTPRPRSIGSKAIGFRVMARQPDADGAVLTHAAGPGRGLQRPAAPVAHDRFVARPARDHERPWTSWGVSWSRSA